MKIFSKPFWLPVSRRTKPSTLIQGGKGANLVRMARAGFRVPPGVILTTHLFSCSKGRDAAFLKKIIARAVGSFSPNTLWAVRSSAVAEDGENASFAGQHDTFLNTPYKELADRVLDCLESAHSSHATTYRDRLEAPVEMSMAVVLQVMVKARCAGVLFTRHPVRPDVNRIVVEGIPGLGEDLVSGRTTPDRIELSRSGKRFSTVSQTRNNLCLDGVGDALFAATARTVEKAMGSPQDVEWAFDGENLWMLQTRPITTLKRPTKVWTRSWGDEFWAEATTDLQYTLMGRWIREDYIRGLGRMSGWDFLARVEPFERIHSHVYFNPEYMRRLLTLVPPAFRMERFLSWMPPYWRAEVASLEFRPGTFIVSQIRSSLKDKNSGMFTHYKKLPLYMEEIRKKLSPGLNQDLSELDDKALWDRFLQNDRMGRKHFRFVRWGLGSYLVPTRMLCAWISEYWTSHTRESDPEGHFFEMLLTSPLGNLTTQVNSEIQALSAAAAKITGLVARLLCEADLPSLEDMAAMPGSAGFLQEFHEFIGRHGHRGSSREVHLPRWMDDPALVLNTVLAFAASDQKFQNDPRHGDLKDSWVKEISLRPGGWWKKPVAERILTLAREYTIYRENQRYALDYILTDMRHVILEIARRLTARGVLSREDDVFFATYEEMEGLWQGALSKIHDLDERRGCFNKDSLRLPPEWIIDGESYPQSLDIQDMQEGLLVGTPASPGVARGMARVVMRVEELRHVRQGEILVAPNTDSGWTPVFGLISGLVVQTGGMLSHAAIVAREYGIPAATGVNNACRIIRTNDMLEVNGHNGTVAIEHSTRELQARAV
ncbi:MAG: hypothetical protein JEZ02_18680 [Desulfatibacillum sp.]|nr:hypothetical protein [Desulfatibacillum sp.]